MDEQRQIEWRHGGSGRAIVTSLLVIAILIVLPWDTRMADAATVARPNIVVVMTDDQTLSSLRHMPRTLALLGASGTTFRDAVVVNPLCCPAQAALLTGQYAKHNRVYNNQPPMGGMYALDHGNTLPVWLQQAGYRTGRIGKAMVGYQVGSGVPPGWDSWQVMAGGAYHDYTLVDGRTTIRHGTAPEDYSTDVFAGRTNQTVRTFAAGEQPFYLQVATFGPHSDVGNALATPAPRHAGTFADEPLPTDPAIGEADRTDKAPAIADVPSMRAGQLSFQRSIYASQLDALLAVDELVDGLVRTLQEVGELDNTVVVFTSDNGYLHGQHNLTAKSLPYEASIRVPLLVRGPGFPAGREVTTPVANLDLAPTIVGLAGASAGVRTDGVDLRTLVGPEAPSTRPVLIESAVHGVGRCFDAVRDGRFKLIRFSDGSEEMYDLRADPFELNSLVAEPAAATILERLRTQLRSLRSTAKPCLPTGEVSLGDLRVVEPASGSQTVNLPVVLSSPQAGDVSVRVAVRSVSSTATIGSDVGLTDPSAVVIPKGAVSASLDLEVLADSGAEEPEALIVEVTGVSGPGSVAVRRRQGTLTVVDRSCCRAIAVGQVAVPEGHVGARAANVPLVLDRPAPNGAVISYRLRHGTTSGADVRVVAGTVSVPPGGSGGEVPLALLTDQRYEPTEHVDIEITAATGGFVPGPAGRLRVLDDDPAIVQSRPFACINETGPICA